MLIEKKSILSGVVRVVNMPITYDQYNDWKGGMLIQDAMPQLTEDQREFMISGITPKEWQEVYGDI